MRKQQHNNFTYISKLIAVLLSVIITFCIGAPAFALSPVSSGEYEEPIMVSLGDSYSSGEGVEPYYFSRSEDKYEQPDWLAHRSRLSWAGKLKLRDSRGKRLTMYQNKAFYSNETKSYDSFDKNNWYFVASSGAVTGSLNGTQGKSFDRYIDGGSLTEHDSVTLDSQLKVFESIEPGTTDYVTMTMGGNDAHFAEVFIYAALNCSFINVNGMDDYIGRIWNEFYNGSNSIKNRLINAYNDIHNAAGNQANIIIAGYPKILPKGGFILFSATESQVIDNAITMLNQEIRGIVNSLHSESFKIHFVSVEEAFEGHEAYTGSFKEYIHGIKFVRVQDLDHAQIISSSSLHPNKGGVKAYALCVQECIDRIENGESSSAAEEGAATLQAQNPENAEASEIQQAQPLPTRGDINRDGLVSILDVAELVSAEDYGAIVKDAPEDLNKDGALSFKDVVIIIDPEIYATQ